MFGQEANDSLLTEFPLTYHSITPGCPSQCAFSSGSLISTTIVEEIEDRSRPFATSSFSNCVSPCAHDLSLKMTPLHHSSHKFSPRTPTCNASQFVETIFQFRSWNSSSTFIRAGMSSNRISETWLLSNCSLNSVNLTSLDVGDIHDDRLLTKDLSSRGLQEFPSCASSLLLCNPSRDPLPISTDIPELLAVILSDKLELKSPSCVSRSSVLLAKHSHSF